MRKIVMKEKQLKEILNNFNKDMKNKGIPFYVAGIIRDSNNNPAIEIVVHRPEKHNNPDIMKRIPKTYQGIKVHVA